MPLDCGATGNCRWALLASKPARLLGTIDGALIYILPRNSGWSRLMGYSSMGAGEGVLETYAHRGGRYVVISRREVRDSTYDEFADAYGVQPQCELKSAAYPNDPPHPTVGIECEVISAGHARASVQRER